MSEQGNAINVAHFVELNTRVAALGAGYTPSNADIGLSKLNNKLTASNDAMDDVGAKNAAQDAVETNRENVFKPLGPRSTQTVNYYASTGTEQNKLDDAKGFQRKIQGKRATPITPPDPADPNAPVPKTISVSQQSYTQKVEHLEGMIEVYKNDPLYNPNEAELTVAGLTAYAVDLKAANNAVISAVTDTDVADDARYNVLYHDKTGMCALANLVKKYVKGKYGATSLEYKQISGLSFTKPRKSKSKKK